MPLHGAQRFFSPRNIGACDLPTIRMLPIGNSKSGPPRQKSLWPERLLKDRRVLAHGERAPGGAHVSQQPRVDSAAHTAPSVAATHAHDITWNGWSNRPADEIIRSGDASPLPGPSIQRWI
jgi:hypothetical protein